MFERSERLCLHGAPSDTASSLAVVQPASGNSRTFRQPFATRWESRRSEIRGRTSLESDSCAIVQSNSFKMITFQNEQDNFLRVDGPGHLANKATLLESAHAREIVSEKPVCAKSFRMITFSKVAK